MRIIITTRGERGAGARPARARRPVAFAALRLATVSHWSGVKISDAQRAATRFISCVEDLPASCHLLICLFASARMA